MSTIENRAYQSGLDERSEVLRLMGTPAYRQGDKAVHHRVETFWRDAYGAGDAPVRTALGPGQVPTSPFAR